MSLNHLEQHLLEYIEQHPEERQYWTDKVRERAAKFTETFGAAADLERLLWEYYRERHNAGAFGAAHRFTSRVSMRTLAELLIRQWTAPKPKRKSALEPLDRPPGG